MLPERFVFFFICNIYNEVCIRGWQSFSKGPGDPLLGPCSCAKAAIHKTQEMLKCEVFIMFSLEDESDYF